MKRIIAVAFTLLATAALADDAMTGGELEALLGNGRKLALGGQDAGYTGELTLKSDGTGSGAVKPDNGKVTKLVGVWYIVGSQFCHTWTGVNDGEEVCETWVKDGNNKVRVLVDGRNRGIYSW